MAQIWPLLWGYCLLYFLFLLEKLKIRQSFIFGVRTFLLLYVSSKLSCQIEESLFSSSGFFYTSSSTDFILFFTKQNHKTVYILNILPRYLISQTNKLYRSPFNLSWCLHWLFYYFFFYYNLGLFLSSSNNFLLSFNPKSSQGASSFYPTHCPKMNDTF